MERGFRDRDYLITRDRLVFTVVGNVHPPDRAISYLKYTPATVRWETYSHKGFSRALKYYTMKDILGTLKFLEAHFPQYIFEDDITRFRFSSVPKHSISRHLRPEVHLKNMLSMKRDVLEEKAVGLSWKIALASEISIEELGVTGSILLNIHDERVSDIDLIVYGRRPSNAVKRSMRDLISEDSDFRRFTVKEIEGFYNAIRKYIPMSRGEYLKIYRRLWNRGRFKNTYFSIHPVKKEEDVAESYGDKKYTPIGQMRVRGVVSNIDESIYLPAEYKVRDVEVLEGVEVEVCEVVCYDGLYSGVAEEGEVLEVKGKLELVSNLLSGEESYMIVVGSLDALGSDYLKLIG